MPPSKKSQVASFSKRKNSSSTTPKNLRKIPVESMETLLQDEQTCLSWLPSNALLILLRNVSLRPWHARWQAWVEPQDLLAILKSGGALAAMAQREFSAIAMDCFPRPPHAVVVAKAWKKGRLFFDIMDELGPSLKYLSIDCFHLHNLATFSHRIVNLQFLSFEDDNSNCALESLLQVCSGKLRFLHLKGLFVSRKRVSAISKYCVGLQGLSLHLNNYSTDMQMLWAALGPSLTDLSLSAPSILVSEDEAKEKITYELVDDIARYCGQVERIEWKRVTKYSQAVVHLCRKIGSRLKCLVLPMNKDAVEMNEASLTEIVEHCPNVCIQRAPSFHQG